MKYLRAALLWGSISIFTILMGITVLVLYPFVIWFDKERHSLHMIGNIWAFFIKISNPWWTFNIKGRENLAPKNTAVIYVANHQSQMDILALFLLNTRFRWIAKSSLFKIPIFGWAMAAIGYVNVIRGNRTSQEKCMLNAAHHIKHGTPMAFFPEGTRSLTGELNEFKTGAFRLAQITGVPIVPISIQGCGKLLPKHSLVPQKAVVTISVHEPIPSLDHDLKTLIQKTREAILTGL